ncbi:polyprenyl synthetase family protein [Butyricicoccus sp.]|uniref:polyprenyl synthetase family protein n=1 Tax=Butyricicoccus sp. TaxID=2049021 RepID=UPI003F16F3CF
MTLNERLTAYSKLVEQQLLTYIQPEEDKGQGIIYEACRYSAMAGGKRLRPALVLEFCRVCGGDQQAALPFACALEMIHTYSLIHDDLPCMDDDDLRRGKPTNHKVYGEATAVLAGDGLLNLAFETASDPKNTAMVSAETQVQAIRALSRASGMDGMIGGQVLDMAAEETRISLDQLKTLQELKTGALIGVAAQLGCLIGRASEEQMAAALEYARCIGLAFQIQDDILDIEGDAETFGKSIGSDAENGKSTYPSLLGLERCHELVHELSQQAADALTPFTDAGILPELALSLADRQK